MTNEEKYKKVLEEYDKRYERNIANAKTDDEADAITHFYHLNKPCCHDEKRNMNGGCDTCGDPCF